MKALLSQADAIDAEYQRMQATIGEGWTVLLNGAERWVGQAATATGAAALLANTLVGLGDNFWIVGTAVAALATVGSIRLVAGLRTAVAATLEKRLAQRPPRRKPKRPPRPRPSGRRRPTAGRRASRAAAPRGDRRDWTAPAAEAAAQNAATVATDRHTAALVANAAAQARVGAAGCGLEAPSGAQSVSSAACLA